MKRKQLLSLLLAGASALALLTGCGDKAASSPSPEEPVTITVWTYYNGEQLESFSALVDEFNATTGKENGVTVECSSQGSVNDLETNVIASAEGKVGAAPMPNIFSAYAGSSSSATFFPSQVITDDMNSHDITRTILPCPKFEDGEDHAVQQGAGMVVTKASDAEIRASLIFLKWFTSPEHNIAFSVSSGYLPVTREGNSIDAIRASGLTLSADMDQVLTVATATVNDNQLYTPRAFSGGTDARAVLEYAMSDKAVADRAAVEERMAQGQSFAEASAEFLSDDCFEAWYQDTLTALQAYEG